LEEAWKFTLLIHETNTDHEPIAILGILDLAEKFHVLENKGESWSIVE
jgi:hypothetical protein